MSDATFLFIEIRRSDREALAQCFGEPREVHPSRSGPAVEILVFHVNYGGTDHLEQLARAGLVFRAQHDEGADYGGSTFAACDGILAAVASPRGELMARIDAATLEIEAADLRNLRLWRDTEDRVSTAFAAAPQAAHGRPPAGGQLADLLRGISSPAA
jgi:hypothetical protein